MSHSRDLIEFNDEETSTQHLWLPAKSGSSSNVAEVELIKLAEGEFDPFNNQIRSQQQPAQQHPQQHGLQQQDQEQQQHGLLWQASWDPLTERFSSIPASAPGHPLSTATPNPAHPPSSPSLLPDWDLLVAAGSGPPHTEVQPASTDALTEFAWPTPGAHISQQHQEHHGVPLGQTSSLPHRRSPTLEELFGDIAGASPSWPNLACTLDSNAQAKLQQGWGQQQQQQHEQAHGSNRSSADGHDGAPAAGVGVGLLGPAGNHDCQQGEFAGPSGTGMDPKLLLIYAVPLIKDRLVFLPVTAWHPDPKEEVAGIAGMMKSSVGKISGSFASMWNSMKDKDPDSLQHKIYMEWQKVVEDMTAEERLMRNIPKQVTKLVVYHPAAIEPSEVQEQLSKMTALYCVKSVGKAGVSGLVLPVAVGMEMLGVPGSGWYVLYQLYKNSVSAAGGQRLKTYLSQGTGANPVRVNWAGDPRLDDYIERSKISPTGVLSAEDIDDLCHDLQETSLLHPLVELRQRYIRKHVKHNSDYALLPVNGGDTGG